MIDQATIKRRDLLLVASSMLAATVVTAMPAAAQTQTHARPKSEMDIPSPSDMSNEPFASPSRGRRVS
jgi:hypothetical protein